MKPNHNKYLLEVEAIAQKIPRQSSKQDPSSYIGGGNSSYSYLGLKVPQVRAMFKKSRFSFAVSDVSEADTFKIWDYIWQYSSIYEVACLPLMYCSESIKTGERLLPYLPALKKWVSKIDNWAHSDSLSSVYARMLEANPAKMFPVLEAWSKAKNPWMRRQSIVSLLYYSSMRKKVLPFNDLIVMVDRQISHEHYYVQKGVGWTLREIGNVYPEKTYKYLEKNIGILSPAAFSASTEKLAKNKKDRLKDLRQKSKVR